MSASDKKLSSARLTQPTNKFVEEFTASVMFDQRMYRQDIQGSIAHATMLTKVGVLTQNERDQIINGLQQIEQEIDNDNFNWSIAQEDVHMNIEARLIQLIGETGKKLHTGRSRNDQVATDVRLYLRDMLVPIRSEMLFDEIRGPAVDAEQLGLTVAEKLLRRGADKILADVYGR